MTVTFHASPIYTLQQVSPYLGGLWEIAKDGVPHLRSSKSSCLEWLNKWAQGRFTVLPAKRFL
jgi:hypothetical protein